MKIIRDERTVFAHQLKNGNMHVDLQGGAPMQISFYEHETGGEESFKQLEHMAATEYGADAQIHLLIVRVKGTKAVAAGLSELKPGEFMYATPFGMLTESQCNERMQNSLHNAAVLYNRNRLIARKARKTGFMTVKAQVLFAVAYASHAEVGRLELQTARDMTSALHNMDFPSHSE